MEISKPTHIEFLVEEQSAEEALKNLVPKIVGDDVSFRIHTHQGKLDLLSKLPNRLKGYSHWVPDYCRIVVLVDEDRGDCHKLKEKLEVIASEAGLKTKSAVQPEVSFQVLNRLAIEELEAWFFGDEEAIRTAYPRIPKNVCNQRRFRDPDAIQGGTWEALEKVFQKYGYFKSRLRKVEVARNISTFMEPQNNLSKSFQVFRDGLLSLR